MTKQLTDEQILDRWQVSDPLWPELIIKFGRDIEAAVLAQQAQAEPVAQAGEFEGDALKLAKGIAEATFKGGVYNGVAPLNGPMLLLLLDDLAEMAARAQAPQGADARDAARYRWLRDAPATEQDDRGVRQWLWTRPASAEGIDAAIDAALAARGGAVDAAGAGVQS